MLSFKIREIKNELLFALCQNLNLKHIDAPIFLKSGTGLQDDLSGVEHSIRFKEFEIPHSLAKWKRHILGDMKMLPGEGIMTDMKAIRQDEILDDLHSYFVDQFDWEKVILSSDRTIEILKSEVKKIWSSIVEVAKKHDIQLHNEVTFISSEDSDKEYDLCKKYKVVFLMKLNNKYGRSPDYDDWSLNGDLLVYDEKHDRVIELSSMGIRVDIQSLEHQMKISGKPYNHFHHNLESYPLTIGGGIGQSRVIMFLLGIKTILDVQPKF